MAAYTLDTTLGQLLADPKAKAVLDQQVPGVSTHPMVGMVSGLSLRALTSNPMAVQLGLTEKKVQTVLDEVNKQV